MPEDSRSSLGTVGRFAGLGFQLVASILLFLYGGQWVDRRLGTDPIFLLVVFIGAAAAIYSMYRSLMAEQRREAAQDAEKRR